MANHKTDKNKYKKKITWRHTQTTQHKRKKVRFTTDSSTEL